MYVGLIQGRTNEVRVPVLLAGFMRPLASHRMLVCNGTYPS